MLSQFVIDTTHDITSLFRKITDKTRDLSVECILDEYITVSSEKNDDGKLKRILAETASEFIYDTVEYGKLCKIISEYGIDADTARSLALSAVNNPLLRKRHTDILRGELMHRLQKSCRLYIDGLVNFRFHDYSSALEADAQAAVDEYNAEKAYREFIDLLKYFVSVQDCGVMCANVYGNSSDGYIITDENGNALDAEYYDEFFSEMDIAELKHDDILISRLISMSPCSIVMHTNGGGKTAETLRLIFENRIHFETAGADI